MGKLNLPKEREFVGTALVWKRILAFIIDIGILFIFVFFPLRNLLRAYITENTSFSEIYNNIVSSPDFALPLMATYIVMLLLAFMYFFILESKMNQTIGKKLLNLYVVSNKDSFSKWQALVRNLAFIPIFPFDLLLIIDPLFMFFNKNSQRLSEILSRTKVVEIYKLDQ